MSFRIAHASIDEWSHITGGTPGDQTGKEVCIRTWYRKPWQYMIRCREEPMREKIARAMEQACGNPCIGYNQVQRNTLLTPARRTGYDSTTGAPSAVEDIMPVTPAPEKKPIPHGEQSPTPWSTIRFL